MIDILYGESSELLTLPFRKAMNEYTIQVIRDYRDFIPQIFRTNPSLIVLGDSLTSNPEELVFALKSLEAIDRIKIAYISDENPDNTLPADLYLKRDEQKLIKSVPFLKEAITSGKMKKNQISIQNLPSGFETENFIYSESRTPVLDKIYQNWISGEIGGLDITEGDLPALLNTITDKCCHLLFADFCRISFRQGNDTISVFSGSIKNETEILMLIKNPDSGKERIHLLVDNNFYQEKADFQFHLLAGTIGRKSSSLPQLEIERIGLQIEKAILQNRIFSDSQRETEMLYRAFCHFLPGSIIDDLILKDSEKELMTGEKREIVVLFSHIRNFDYIMEHNQPQSVVDFLNNHFSNMVSIIQWYGGTIDKFIGDAVFAIFGAPVSYTNNAERAANAARDMIEQYPHIDTEDLQLPECGFKIGVGLNEGNAIIGNIGCSDKFDYTAIGDTVNLAARLESLTKHYQCPILISEKVNRRIEKERFTRLVDTAKVKGKTEPSHIFSLEMEPERFSEEWLNLYQKAIKMYRIGNWVTSGKYFEMALEIIPDDFPTLQYLERCAQFMNDPPSDWNGAVTLDFK